MYEITKIILKLVIKYYAKIKSFIQFAKSL